MLGPGKDALLSGNIIARFVSGCNSTCKLEAAGWSLHNISIHDAGALSHPIDVYFIRATGAMASRRAHARTPRLTATKEHSYPLAPACDVLPPQHTDLHPKNRALALDPIEYTSDRNHRVSMASKRDKTHPYVQS